MAKHFHTQLRISLKGIIIPRVGAKPSSALPGGSTFGQNSAKYPHTQLRVPIEGLVYPQSSGTPLAKIIPFSGLLKVESLIDTSTRERLGLSGLLEVKPLSQHINSGKQGPPFSESPRVGLRELAIGIQGHVGRSRVHASHHGSTGRNIDQVGINTFSAWDLLDTRYV